MTSNKISYVIWMMMVVAGCELRKQEASLVTRILYVGYEPDTVDYSNPALLPGMNAEKIRAGNAVALKQFADRGWQADMVYVRPDGTAGLTLERQLAANTYDCVVIGAGIRVLGKLEDFEAIINAIHRSAPATAIAFNTRPEDSAEAAARLSPHR